MPALCGIPIAVVTGETSHFAPFGPNIVEFLKNAGAAADFLHLPVHGVHGNGHGLIYKKNSDAALEPILRWLEQHVSG